MNPIIRDERTTDIAAIREVTKSAFERVTHSSHTEHLIVDALRQSKQLTISMVAVLDGTVVGHVAFSPVLIDGRSIGWFGLGPVSVIPAYQGQTIGSQLVQTGLQKLRVQRACGCVVFGSPIFYGRFGFAVHSGLEYPGGPREYFQGMSFDNDIPQGEVSYHPSFDVVE